MFSKSFIFAVVVALGAYSYLKYYGPTEEDRIKDNIISAWHTIIREPSSKFRRVAVGVNADVDLIVPGIELLNALNVVPGDKSDHESLDSLSKLQETFALFFSRGSAAERYFADADLYRTIVQAAESLASVQSFIGGNAALMANKVSSLFPDTEIQFVGPVGPGLQKLLPKSIKVPAESLVAQDEVHLIMEYKVGDHWGNDVTPVASRFITSHDESNAQANMLETFFASLNGFNADLVLLSGLHMMEGLEADMFDQRLQVLVSGLESVPSHVPVHLELASMAKEDYLHEILDKVVPSVSSIGLNEQELGFFARVGFGNNLTNMAKVLPHVSSLGLNEQEIAFSSSVADGPHTELFKGQSGQPEIHKISDMILWILRTYGYSNKRTQSRLTRVHFHSLTYHIIGVIPSAWQNTESAVAAGTRLAGRQACDVDHLSSKIADLKIPLKFKLFSEDQERLFDGTKPVLSWDREGFHFAFSPVLVCKNPEKTVGLGDSISSTGLLYSQYHHSYRVPKSS